MMNTYTSDQGPYKIQPGQAFSHRPPILTPWVKTIPTQPLKAVGVSSSVQLDFFTIANLDSAQVCLKKQEFRRIVLCHQLWLKTEVDEIQKEKNYAGHK